MMRKIGLKRPNKLNLGAKKVNPPLIPGDQSDNVRRISGVYSEAGDYGQHPPEFNVSFDSVQSEGVREVTRDLVRDDCSDSSYGQASGSSSGYGSHVQYDVDQFKYGRQSSSTSSFHQQQRHVAGEFKEPYPGVVLRQNGVAQYYPSTPGSSVGSPTDPRDTCRNSMSSLDSGWASNNVPLSSFCSRTSASSLNSDKTSNEEHDHPRPMSTFQNRRLSTLSSTSSCHPAPVPPPQRTSSIRTSFRGSSESVSSSRCSQSDIYRPNTSRRYSSSSSISSSRNGEDSICTMDIRQMILQGLPDLEIVNCWLTDLRFEEYFSLFASAGYDMPTISRMTPEDLTAIGIKKPHHRKKLKSEIDKLQLHDWLPQHLPQSVEAMMHELNLGQYTQPLLSQGYNTVKDVLAISIEDLEDVGFFMLGHQKRLLLGIKRIKELRSGKKPSIAEYQPEEVTMSSLPPTLPSKQSFSSFHAQPGRSNQSNQLRFPPHGCGSVGSDQSAYDPSFQLHQQPTTDMPSPMQPLNHNFYQTFSNSSQNFGIHHAPPPAEIPKSSSSIWQKFPSYQDQVIKDQPSSTINAQIHDHPVMNGGNNSTGTLTRRDKDLQIFSCEFSNSGTLPRPTATVKPLTPPMMTGPGNDVPVVCDDVCSDHNMPFANERLGTIRLKTNPQEVFAEYEKEEQAKEDQSSKNLLRTPTRAANRSATDVMDDISTMLADLTTELDSMLCSDSIE